TERTRSERSGLPAGARRYDSERRRVGWLGRVGVRSGGWVMKRIIWLLLSVLWSVPAGAQGKLNVVTTTEDLAAVAREVGGDRIAVEALAKGYQDPHFVEAKPSFILKLQKADVLIVVGRELEIGWLPPLIQQSRNAKIQP